MLIAMAATRRSTRGETDAERMAGTFGSKTGITRKDFTAGDRGLAVWRAALVMWCFVGLPCVCLGDHCDGCDKTHSSPATGAPFEYVPQRSGDEPHPGATAPIHEPPSRLTRFHTRFHSISQPRILASATLSPRYIGVIHAISIQCRLCLRQLLRLRCPRGTLDPHLCSSYSCWSGVLCPL